MTATNVCSNFGSKWLSPPLMQASYVGPNASKLCES